jgi:hypothetical protein
MTHLDGSTLDWTRPDEHEEPPEVQPWSECWEEYRNSHAMWR